MDRTAHEVGVIGLGRMGGGLALQALQKGMQVVGVDPGGASDELREAGLIHEEGVAGLQRLQRPRRVLVYVPAGPLVDEVLDAAAGVLDEGDVLVDGGNSYWGDSVRRPRALRERGLHLLDLGTSGGVEGAREGACFMLGGEREAVAHVEPVLRKLAVEGGYVHAGPPGAGHFTKLVHNGIEFGMLQAIAEGVDLLAHHHEPLPIADVLRCWSHGSVIRSWLVELMERELRARGGLDVPAYVEDTGEVNWLVADALELERPIPIIAQAVMQLLASRDADKTWAQSVSMMRHGFGGHPYGEDTAIRRERREGRVGDVFRDSEREPKRS